MTIQKEVIFKYIVIVVFGFWFFNNAFIPDTSFIVSITACAIIIYYLEMVEEISETNLNNELFFKLNYLLKKENRSPPEYFHIEPDMINFFYKIRDFRIYNRDAYYKSIKHTNLLLKIASELENDYFYINQNGYDSWQMFGPLSRPTIQSNIKNHKEMFQKARYHGQLALNYLHSFSVTIPGGIFRKKFNHSLKESHILIKRIIDNILIHCKRFSKDILINESYGLPKPFVKEKDAINNFNFILV